MTMAPLTHLDLPSLRTLQPPDWSDITPRFEYYLAKPFCTPMKATIDDTVVGIGAGISLGKTGWLGHIIVRPDYRRRGIGSAIVDHLVRSMRESGCHTISLIATDVGYPTYLKAGFVLQTEYAYFERSEPLDQASPQANVRPCIESDHEVILRLDGKASGEDRRVVLAEHLHSSLVYERDGRCRGFYAPDLKDGLIIADDVEAGVRLLRERLSRATRNVLPVENTDGIRFLLEVGFKETDRIRRMVLGEPYAWRPRHIYGRIAGNLG